MIFKVNKELTLLHTRKTNNPIKKWARHEQTVLLGGHIMAQRHIKECSSSLALREMQVKITMRYHFTPVRIAIIKKSTNNECWRGC